MLTHPDRLKQIVRDVQREFKDPVLIASKQWVAVLKNVPIDVFFDRDIPDTDLVAIERDDFLDAFFGMDAEDKDYWGWVIRSPGAFG